MRDGRIRSLQMKMICDGGAYGLSTEGVMRKAAILAAGPYVIPNVRIDTFGIYTNNTPSGAFRSFGALQSSAVEDSNVDLTGELVNMITAQRNYQANAQTIKTQDQVMQTLVNLR